jgi:hypothetical protein
MENIPDPKYKIGDVILTTENTELLIKNFFYQVLMNKWIYICDGGSYIEEYFEDQIIKKLN